MQFVKLNAKQLTAFLKLKTSKEMHHHGPLKKGEEVSLHSHNEVALYVVQGAANYRDGVNETRVGEGAEFDAVRVDAGDQHGWKALKNMTLIEHAFGPQAVQSVLVAG